MEAAEQSTKRLGKETSNQQKNSFFQCSNRTETNETDRGSVRYWSESMIPLQNTNKTAPFALTSKRFECARSFFMRAFS